MTGVTEPQPTPTTRLAGILLLSALLRRTAVDGAGHGLGRLSDIIVRLREGDYPAVTGLVANVGGRELFIPADEIVAWDDQHLELASARLDLRPFERRTGEVLLSGDILGHRLVDVEEPGLVTAHDVQLTSTGDGWVVTAVDIHPRGRLRRRNGHTWRDWSGFEALIGHDGSLASRAPLGGMRRLKPAELADIIEDASDSEQHELLERVHAHPELEADVFEELDEDRLTQLLRTRSAADVASVLDRMRADDAADAITDLPQDRRQAVLDLLNEPQRIKVMNLLGYHDATAGGLMGVEFVRLPETATVHDAISLIRAATSHQPEALTTIFSVDDDDRLVGAISLVRALQVAPESLLRDVAESDPVHAAPQDDIVDVTTRMADFNLLVLPVLDEHGRILGVVTVDDALEAALPQDWRRREPQPHVSST